MSKQDKNICECPERLGKVGGQAVLEGVMMKAGDRTVTTCRKEDGSLVVTDDNFVSVRTKNKFYDLPIIRGVVSFIESMLLSFKTLGASAEALGLEDETEEPSKFEKWLADKLGAKITDVVMVVALILGLGLSVLLFLFLPIWITAGINIPLAFFGIRPMPDWLTSLVEGIVKTGIFIGYLAGVSLMPDIKRTFMYHGAEHKSIACFEAGEELTPENAAKHTRFHPRCGTSFMFFMILLGIFAGFIIRTLMPGLETWAYSLIRLAVLPILMGLGYEFIRYAGKHPSAFTRALSAPGLWVQRITTKEPTLDMLEVAITSLKCSLRDDFPEFKEFYDAKPWEVKAEDTENVENQPDEAEQAVNETEQAVNEAEQAVNETEQAEQAPAVAEAADEGSGNDA